MNMGGSTAARVILIAILMIAAITGCARPKPTVPGTPLAVEEAPTDTPTSVPYPGPATETPTSTPTATAWPPTATTVLISPPSQEIAMGQNTTVDIRIEGVTDLFGAEVHLSFDPAKLEVQDANPAVAGVQIEVGTFPDPAGGRGFVAQNSADNSTGKIDYAVTLLSPTQPVSGDGVLARVAFKAIGEGTSPVAFINALLSDQTGTQIPATTADGTIKVVMVAPTPTGTPPTPTATPTPAPGTPTPTATPVPGGFPYVVRWGDTLWAIALRFGTTVEAIVQANNIADPDYILAGQTLIIPGVPPPAPVVHIVQPGDTLWAIALRYGTTVKAICWANRILNPDLIYVGQRLVIPTGAVIPPPRPIVYTVQPGDTLWAIALRYGTTPWAIAIANNIPNPNLIFVGQRLVIP